MRAVVALFLGASVSSTGTAFVLPGARTAVGTPFLSSPQTALSASATVTDYLFDGYDKPVVLIGASSSPEADELRRLASSLGGSLAGDNPANVQTALERLGRSKGAGMVDVPGGATGISLSAVGMEDGEGPSVADAALVSELIREGTLSLASGVIVLDFGHAAFGAGDDAAKKDLTLELSSLAKRLYEDEGVMAVYVNVANEATEDIEKDVMIPFTDYEICIRNEGTEDTDSWAGVEWELRRIVARALLPPPAVGATGTADSADLVMGLNTFFLSLSFPRVEDAAPYVEQMCQDVDSMEYRVDLLSAAKDYLKEGAASAGPRFDIMYQQQRLRALCRPHAQRAPGLPFAGTSVVVDALPIVYTVRTAGQAGTWPDDEGGIEKMFGLLELGLRSAAEVLDVESAWSPELTTKLLAGARSRYTSLILGSHHVVGTQVPMDEAVDLFLQCGIQGRAHGAKVVLSITSNDDNEDMLAYNASVAAAKIEDPEIPNISLLLGEIGCYSRILNPRFTPVTHECLPSVAAPGQLTAAEIMAGKMLDGRLASQRFGILGHNIAYSVSPEMHSAAFAAVKLPHTYVRADLETVEEFVEGPVWNDDEFGGCSVTIPHKQSIVPHLDVLTDAAKEIGSVNTVIVKKDKFGKRVLIGDNTDWKGMYNPLQRRVGDDVAKAKKEGGAAQYALVLGGGGTARAAAYAASELGLERIYWNRTPEKAADLAKEFGGVVAGSLDAEGEGSLGAILAEGGGGVRAVISTIPKDAGFTLPEWMLADGTSLPVVLDVNYKPYNTPLLLQVTGKGCDVVRGSEMLWEQGVGQFELWTGRTAPYGVMKKVVLENCLPKEE